MLVPEVNHLLLSPVGREDPNALGTVNLVTTGRPKGHIGTTRRGSLVTQGSILPRFQETLVNLLGLSPAQG